MSHKPFKRIHADLRQINRKIVPAFYSVLQAQEFGKQAENTKKLQEEIAKIVEVSDPQGPFFIGQHEKA